MTTHRIGHFALSAALILAVGLAIGTAQEPLTAATIAQSSQQAIPNLVRTQGVLGGHESEKVVLRFAVYAAEGSRDPLWSEEQLVQTDSKGGYSALLGAGSAIGLPQSLFATGEPRWLGVQVGDHEELRSLLTSVPYALKAADSDSLGGVPATNFVTQAQLAAKLTATAAALTQRALQPMVAPTGTGTVGYLPIWTSSTALGNSGLFQTGTGAASKVGIGTTTPASSLDVNGVTTLRARVALSSTAATATAGVSSPFLEWIASSYSSALAAPVAQNFVWQVQPLGNNTATPSSQLSLLYSSGTHFPAATGLSIAPSGVITFAPGQSFPASSTAGSFPKGATFGAESFMTGSSTDWMLVATNTSATSKGTILGQANANGIGVEGASPGGIGVEGATDTGYGVYGTASTTGTAVYGGAFGTGPAGSFWSLNASGPAVVVSNVAGGAGISSTATNGYGGYFSNNSTYQATVSAANAGDGNAGLFNNNSSTRVALAGINASAAVSAIGTYGSVANGNAVYGISPYGSGIYGTSDYAYAVYGNSATAYGIFGNSPISYAVNGTTGAGVGVNGISTTGIALQATSTSGTSLYTHSSLSGVALNALTQDNNAGQFSNSSTKPTVIATNYGSGPIGLSVPVFMAAGKDGTCAFASDGDLGCTGRVKALVSVASNTRTVETYSVQSPENWLEDFGSATLSGGTAHVALDPAFAETVTASADYHVFLTPRGDSRGLYVTNVTPSGFEVRESGSGTSSLAFDYRIVAKRRGFESQRLVDVTEQMRAEAEARNLKQPEPAPLPKLKFEKHR